MKFTRSQLTLLIVLGVLTAGVYCGLVGWTYYVQERYTEAVATLEEAAALATVEGEVVYGEILEHLDEARAAQ